MFLLFAVPLATYAFWWNPLSWNDQEIVHPAVPEPKISEPKKAAAIVVTPKPEVVTKTVIKEVDNPALISQIASLSKENLDLKSKIDSQASLVEQLNVCKNTIVNTPPPPVISSKEAKLKTLDNEAMDKLGEMTNMVVFPPEVMTRLGVEINLIIDKYKIADPSFAHDKIRGTKQGLTEFKSWLQSYIQYRN